MHLPKLTEASVLPSNIAEAGEMSRRDFVSAMFALGFCPIPLLGCDFLNNSGFKTLSETVCKDAHMPTLGQIIKTLDGGYAFPENTIVEGRYRTGLVKLNGIGEVEWHCQIKNSIANLELSGLLQTRRGDFYLLGEVAQSEPVQDLWPQPLERVARYPAIVKVNALGQQVPYRIQSVLTPISYGVIRYGVEVEDGLIFFGLKSVELGNKNLFEGGYNKATSLWIFKINHQGQMVWERLIQTDADKLVKEAEPIYSMLTKPLIDADGTIVFATSVIALCRNPQTGLYGGALPCMQDQHVVLIRFDVNGNELSRGRIARHYARRLLPDSNSGFQIFSGVNEPTQGGIYRIQLDKNFQTKFETFIPVENFNLYDVVSAAKPDEFYLLGDTRNFDSNRTNATVLYLDQSKRIAHHIRYGKETNAGVSLVLGNVPNEVVFVHQQQGVGYGDAHFTRLTVAN